MLALRKDRDGPVRGIDRVNGYSLDYCCCPEKGNQESTLVGKLVAVNFNHDQLLGLSMPVGNRSIKSVREGIKMSHVGMGSEQNVTRPLTWGNADGDAGERSGMGGMLWIGLALWCSCRLRASEMFANVKWVFHEVRFLRGGDMAFFGEYE